MASRRLVRWAAIAMAALLVAGLVVGVAASIGGSGDSASTTTSPSADDTVPRDGDPAFCAAIVDFQSSYGLIAEPGASADPAQVEAGWNTLSEASGRLVDTAPQDMAGIVQPVVAAFDQMRIDADAAGYDYASIDDLPSSATIDPDAQIAQNAYTLLVYGESRCPVDTTATTTATNAATDSTATTATDTTATTGG